MILFCEMLFAEFMKIRSDKELSSHGIIIPNRTHQKVCKNVTAPSTGGPWDKCWNLQVQSLMARPCLHTYVCMMDRNVCIMDGKVLFLAGSTF